MPTINNPDEDVMSELRARLPGWTAEERALWLDLLEAFSVPLLPTAEEVVDKQPREREERAIEAVMLGARLADVAIQEFQFRLFAQSAPRGNKQLAAEINFDRFSEWLERTRPVRRARPVTARRKR